MSSTPTPSSATLGGDIRRFPGAPRLGLWERGLAFSTCRTASPYPQPLLQAIRSWPFPVALFSVGPFLLSQGPFLPRRDCPRPRGGFSFSLHTPPLGLTLGCWWPFSTTAFPGPTLSLYLFFCSFFLLSAALWTEPRTNLSIVCLFLPPIPSPGLCPFLSFASYPGSGSFDLTCLPFCQRKVKSPWCSFFRSWNWKEWPRRVRVWRNRFTSTLWQLPGRMCMSVYECVCVCGGV